MKTMRKAQMNILSSTSSQIMVVGIILIFGLIILNKFGAMDEITGDEDAYTAFNDTKEAMTSIPEWLPILVLVIIAGIVLFFVFRYLGGRSAK